MYPYLYYFMSEGNIAPFKNAGMPDSSSQGLAVYRDPLFWVRPFTEILYSKTWSVLSFVILQH